MIRDLLNATLFAALIALTSSTVCAASLATFPHHQIESWHDQGMVFVVRDAEGHIQAHAKGHLERWTSENQMVWVVRDAQGKFMTFAHGQVETWADGTKRIVLRNNDGKFVAVGMAYVAGQHVQEANPADVMHVLASF